MNLTCRDLLKLPSMKRLHLVAGEKGLDRIVTWTYFAEGYELRPWLNGGELIIYSTLKENRKGNSLEKLIRVCKEADAACILIYVNEQFTSIPNSLKELGDMLEIPLFEVPWEVKAVQLTREISNYIFKSTNQDDFMGELLKNILLGKEKNMYAEELVNHITLKENKGYVVSVIMFDSKDYNQSPQIFNYYRSCLQYALSSSYQNVCSCILKHFFIVLIPQKEVNVYETGEKIQISLDNIREKNNLIKFNAGISREYNNYREITKAFKEALHAVEYGSGRDDGKDICYYEKFGIEKLLFQVRNSEELEILFKSCIGKVMTYDLEHDGNLCDTLICFLANNCDLNITSEKLFIHKNSLRYRLKKIENLTHRKFSNMDDLSEFFNSWKIGKYLRKF